MHTHANTHIHTSTENYRHMVAHVDSYFPAHKLPSPDGTTAASRDATM